MAQKLPELHAVVMVRLIRLKEFSDQNTPARDVHDWARAQTTRPTWQGVLLGRGYITLEVVMIEGKQCLIPVITAAGVAHVEAVREGLQVRRKKMVRRMVRALV